MKAGKDFYFARGGRIPNTDDKCDDDVSFWNLRIVLAKLAVEPPQERVPYVPQPDLPRSTYIPLALRPIQRIRSFKPGEWDKES